MSYSQSETNENASDFIERELIHNQILEQAKESPEDDVFGWSRASGKYLDLYPKQGDLIDTDEKKTGTIECLDKLSEVETVLLTQIRTLIKHRLNEGNKSPVVCVDIGGMNAISFLKISEQLKQEISDGQVELITTSLGYSPTKESLSDELKNNPEEDYSQIIASFQKKLVRYFLGDISELSKTLISEGKKIAIVHEKDALMHGYVNDRDLKLLFDILADDGNFIISNLEQYHFENNAHSDKTFGKERFAAHINGLKYILARGGHVVNLPFVANSLIISASKSPIGETILNLSKPES